MLGATTSLTLQVLERVPRPRLFGVGHVRLVALVIVLVVILLITLLNRRNKR